jgi:hypothetical protein
VADLLGTLVEAHGGLKRWNELETVTAHLAQGGVLRALKGQQGVLDDVFVTASLHEERESHYPFGAVGRLRVVWPGHLATHSAVQTVYVGDDGLIRREDYDVDILGGSTGAHYMSGYTPVAGIMIPTGHRIFPRTPEGQALTEPLLVSIDLSEITFA